MLSKIAAHALTMFAVLSLLTVAPSAPAQDDLEATIEVTRNGVTSTLSLPVYRSQGVRYASFADIARQLGARVEIADARAIMTIDGQQAEVGLEDNTAQAGSTAFTLQHPVRGYNGDALIAITDLTPFLRQSFGIGTPDNLPEVSALNPPPDTPPTEAAATESPDAAMGEIQLEAIELEPTTFESITPVTPSRPLNEPSFTNAGSFLLAIDAGHGGDDTGVVGPGGVVEKDICLSVATTFRRILKEQYGIATIMTRDEDELKSVQARVNAVTTERANLIVSIHGGATYATNAMGPVLFAHRSGQQAGNDIARETHVAQSLAKSLEAATGVGVPVHEARLGLLRHAEAPGVMVELGNLSNPEEAARLSNEQYQAQLAAALAEGINQVVHGAATGGTTP